MLYLSNKEKNGKEILNNDLAVLPSHDTNRADWEENTKL